MASNTSKPQKVLNLSRHTCIAENVRLAQSFFARLAGLLFSPPLAPGEGLLIMPCNSIHMLGMRYAIDVIFFDKQWRVAALVENIQPGQFSPLVSTACSCLELPSGSIASSLTEIDDRCALADMA